MNRALLAAVVGLAGCVAACVTGCARAEEPAVVVFAAASTAPVIEPLARRHTEETGVAVRCQFAGSATLARQIELGAHADIFCSASPQWTDHLAAGGWLAAGSRRTLASNRLAIVVPHGAEPAPVALDGTFPADRFGRFATADPEIAPLGVYARAALTTLGWWDAVADTLIRVVDARAALRLVEMGEVDGAIVYASDAVTSSRVAVVALVPESLHPPIVYPVSLTRDASAAAPAFVDRLVGRDAADRFRAAGFVSRSIEVPDAR
ncbi:MAG: molybdate ABC transporter substrate-binding protein [Phycisphaerales bacterium]|nr:molybdate ABC transporter substrate-binding protein [Phycisphaerae bacterium]NNM25387.1 molybdate ABC transporter substrate-binding protein [Phycisphaerales bacterium]